ncbi:MAG: oligosaccharide flippase family protein [Solobacterium sp.]|nr:oligosaccharide flippase family protein [Solobacterium sp.]
MPKVFAFITLPILTAYLTKKEYGTYDLIATLVMLAIPVATLQIQTAAFRFLIDCRGDKEKSSEIVSNIFAVTIPVSLIVSIIVQFFFREWSMAIRIMIAVYFFLDTIHLTVAQVARGIGNNKAYSVSAIIVSATSMLTIVATVSFMRIGLLGVCISLALSQLFSTIYLIWKIDFFSYLSFRRISRKGIRELLAYSWPMVPNNLSGWVLKLSDRLVITAFLGVEANAVYAVANKIPNLLSTAQAIMVMAWHENASIAVEDQDADQYYTKMLDRVFDLMFGCTVLLIAATPILFRLLIRGDYAEAYYHMPVLILAMFFCVMASYFGGIYIAHKRTVNVGISTMVAAGINLMIDLLFVNIIGIWAGSVSTLVSYIVLYVYRMMNTQTFQKIEVNYKKQILLILIMIVLLISCFMQKPVLNIINIVAAVVLFFALNKDVVRVLWKRAAGKIKKA